MRIAIASDHGGYRMKNILKQYLATELAIEVIDDFGPYDSNSVDYPDFAVMVARSVANGSYDIGIMLDGVGIGSTMAANKIRGKTRKRVPAGTNELSKRLKFCKGVKRVNPKCDRRKPIALWDFVD